MKHLFFSLSIFSASVAFAQTAHENAFTYMKAGDHDNAILVLNKAIQTEPENEQLLQDLALAYFYKKDFTKAKEYAVKLMSHENLDVVSYQIAGMVYRALLDTKEAEKVYKKGLKNYPKSGVLYNDYGEMFWERNDAGVANAIKEWEKGIQADPSYPSNYYNASTFYFYSKEKIWSIIYGEIFVNMEYLTDRAKEVKEQLLKAYKEKLFINYSKNEEKTTSPFAKAVYETYNQQTPLTGRGVSTETLTMIRTKFLLDWYNKYAKQYPFRLFDYQQQLIREGMFEAYNQWLFGPVENLTAFDQWTKANAEAYKKFINFQHGRIFKVPAGQFYGEWKSDENSKQKD